jgi:2-iminobutanoate/2-iminopropanoate deaminase
MAANRQVVRIGPYKDFIASGVKVGDTITLSGQISLNQDGEVIGAGDIAAQVRQCYVNIKEVLDEFGASMDDIVDEMWLVTDIDAVLAEAANLMPLRDEFFGGSYNVTQTMIQISRLVMPELLIEIKTVARV